MAHFSISPEAVVQRARDLFLSEDFINSFNLLKDSFEIDYCDIISLLHGNLDIVDSDLVEGTDEDYKSDVKDILSNHDFIITHNNKYYQITSSIPFDISKQFNDLSNYLKKHENNIIFEGAYFNILTKMLNSLNYFSQELIIYSDNKIYILEPFKKNIFQDITTIYEIPYIAIKCFNEYHDSI